MSLDHALDILGIGLDEVRTKDPHPTDWNLDQIAESKLRVLARYGPVFSPANVGTLERSEFLDFLRIENNEHWSGIDRSGAKIASDMPRLRRTLELLVDESVPIVDRLEAIYPGTRPAMIPYLGRAILTPILQVAYPASYGVLNTTSEGTLRRLRAWPRIARPDSFPEAYTAVNDVLLRLAEGLDIDLWTLDTLLWRVSRRPGGSTGRAEVGTVSVGAPSPNAASSSGGRAIALRSGLAIPMTVAEDRLLRFFREEYAYYDGIPDGEPDRILPVDVLATVAMNSRVDDAKNGYDSARRVRTVHRGLATRCDPILPEIPADADLLDVDPAWPPLAQLFASAVRAELVLAAVATKVLHRKRRALIPMLDNVVLDYYLDAYRRSDLKAIKSQKPHAAAVALEVLGRFREDLLGSRADVEELRCRLEGEGFSLTPVRILEVLVWTAVERQGYYRG